MYRILRSILSLLLAATFLVSFTGVRLLVHQCMGCETSEIVFAGEAVSCCASSQADLHLLQQAEGNSSCCAIPGSKSCSIPGESACCDIEVVYLKGDFQIAKRMITDHTEFLSLDDLTSPSTNVFDMGIVKTSLVGFSYIDPPPRMVGKAFVFFAHHIKIA